MKRFQRFLSNEIGIEYKACLYFFAMGFYYCMYQLAMGNTQAAILHLAEMIFATYIMCYLQFYLLRDFDESERFGFFEGAAAVGCSGVYGVLSWLLGWYDKSAGVTVGFFFYVCFLHLCMFAINKIKRDIDTKILNDELKQFKKRGGQCEE